MVKANPLPAPRVLLVEDSLPVRKRIRSLIEESGPVEIVGEAASVTDALAQFRAHQPEVVVLDLQLVDGTAYAVLQEIKETQPACVVIVLTNLAIAECRERCRTLGADFFFNKSTEFDRVPEVLARWQQPADSTRNSIPGDCASK